jgi:hypothetical protein
MVIGQMITNRWIHVIHCHQMGVAICTLHPWKLLCNMIWSSCTNFLIVQ